MIAPEDTLGLAGETNQSFFSVSQTSGAPSDGSLALEKLRVANDERQHQHISRICRICGRVVSAKGLPRFDSLSLSDPYCLVKAIKGNNHTMNVHATRAIMNSSTPFWDEEFDFSIGREETTEEIVGLRVTLYDADGPTQSFSGSNDFLGGADLDLASQKHARSVLHELELGGIMTRKAGGRRPRLVIAITVYREVVPRPLPRPVILKQSLLRMSYINQVFGTVVSATDLPNKEVIGLSDPFCIVRAVLMSGKVQEIHRTSVIQNSLKPIWRETFQAAFSEQDQPLLLLFDLWDEDDPNKPLEEGGAEHLGSAAVPMLSCVEPAPRRRKLWLQGASQRHESRFNHSGVSRNTAASGGMIPGVKLTRQRSSHGLKEDQKKKTFNFSKGSKSLFERLKDAAVEFKNQITEKPNAAKKPVLSVELRTYTKSAKMPYAHLFQKPMFIHDADDLEKCLESPDWTRSSYTFPKQLESDQPERGSLTAEDHIAFVYGSVAGASFLPASHSQPPEAYCMVHAVSTNGVRHFVHRTRIIKQMICPQWSEAFYAAMPEDFDCARLQVSVYGATATNLMTKATSTLLTGSEALLSEGSNHEDDWFIGRAHIDLTTALSGSIIAEEAPIQGGTASKQERVTTGFRIQPSVAFEVMVERRLRPRFNANSGDSVKMIPRRHHQLTRTTDPIQNSLPIIDNGQQLAVSMEQLGIERAAQEVLELHNTGTLAFRKGLKHDWCRHPSKGDEEEEMFVEKPLEELLQESGEGIDMSLLEVSSKKIDGQARVVDFSKRELRRQARSLPLLKTKFHDSPQIYQLSVAGKATLPHFSRRTEHAAANISRSLQEKPLFSSLHWHEPADLPVVHLH